MFLAFIFDLSIYNLNYMRYCFIIGVFLFSVFRAGAQQLENETWKILYNPQGVYYMGGVKDTLKANLLEGELGSILLAYKIENGKWLQLNGRKRSCALNEDGRSVSYRDTAVGEALVLTQIFRLDGEKLHWQWELKNCCDLPVEIGDLAFQFPWCGGGDTPEAIFERAFTKHAFISGDASFLYFSRYGGMAPYYLLTVDPGTQLEYYDISEKDRKYRAYIYSGKSGGREKRGTWRQEHTTGYLQPAGQDGDCLKFGFTFQLASSYQDMRDRIYTSRSIDTRVVPGMTLPLGQKAKFALRTPCSIDSIRAEYPGETFMTYWGESTTDSHIYEVEFKRLGENKLTVYFDGGRKTYLEFFSCESPEVLVKKRSAFLAGHQQFRDSTKWYNGLYGVYDMKNGELRGPDNPDIYDEVLTYFLASDDPVLGKAPFLASKNVVFPDDKEIASLEYYLENFVWGKMQRTGLEFPYPYGVYGTPDWYVNRHPELRKTQTEYKLDKMRVWRTYDYAHMIMLWYEMYRIAELYPEKSHYLDADGYLERAYQTAKAYFIYPMELLGEYYETFKWGCYNERVIPELIRSLEKNGRRKEAGELRRELEKKAKYFIYDDPYPYRSEYAVDRTAFESTYALAVYACEHDMKPDRNLWFDKNTNRWYSHPEVSRAKAREFMERQHYANLSSRGVLENQWYMLGSDFFHSSDGSLHSYMARMGGGSILDYGLRYADIPYDWIQLGYASYLGPYGLMNTGNAESGYGYWYPGKEKDGAMGQAFTPLKYGHPWIGNAEARGPWRYCGEGDLGMCAVTRVAATILADDPVFGWTVFGGRLNERDGQFLVLPDDGVRQKFWLVHREGRMGLELDRDNWSADSPLIISKDLQYIELPLVSGTETMHHTFLKITVSGGQIPVVWLDGRKVAMARKEGNVCFWKVPVSGKGGTLRLQWKK